MCIVQPPYHTPDKEANSYHRGNCIMVCTYIFQKLKKNSQNLTTEKNVMEFSVFCVYLGLKSANPFIQFNW